MSSLAGETMQRMPVPGQPLVGERHPALDAGQHLRLEPGVDQRRVGRPGVDLVAASGGPGSSRGR